MAVILLMVLETAYSKATIFDFEVEEFEGNSLKLDVFKSSKVILIVNTASQCGYTHINYDGLQKIYDRLHHKGLEILGFPCNQFGRQEPGSNTDIQYFVTQQGITFPIFSKTNVHGTGSHPLFKFLKENTGDNEIMWNFTKFLIVDGTPIRTYPTTCFVSVKNVYDRAPIIDHAIDCTKEIVLENAEIRFLGNLYFTIFHMNNNYPFFGICKKSPKFNDSWHGMAEPLCGDALGITMLIRS
eukprot:gene1862-3609_t